MLERYLDIVRAIPVDDNMLLGAIFKFQSCLIPKGAGCVFWKFEEFISRQNAHAITKHGVSYVLAHGVYVLMMLMQEGDFKRSIIYIKLGIWI